MRNIYFSTKKQPQIPHTFLVPCLHERSSDESCLIWVMSWMTESRISADTAHFPVNLFTWDVLLSYEIRLWVMTHVSMHDSCFFWLMSQVTWSHEISRFHMRYDFRSWLMSQWMTHGSFDSCLRWRVHMRYLSFIWDTTFGHPRHDSKEPYTYSKEPCIHYLAIEIRHDSKEPYRHDSKEPYLSFTWDTTFILKRALHTLSRYRDISLWGGYS